MLLKSTTINVTLNPSYANQHTLIWALICSLLLHAITSYYLKFNITPPAKPDTLVVELTQQQLPPPPVTLPEPPKVEPVKPKIVSKPITKPTLLPIEAKNDTATPPPAPTEVIAVTPKPEAPPSPVPPVPIATPDPPQPIITTPPDTSAARETYGNTLWGAIGKHKQYPRIAQMRGWQGEAVVELQLDGNGKLKSKKIIQSSGYDALDKQALEMVERAIPFPAPPEVLRGGSFSIKVPIPFKLE